MKDPILQVHWKFLLNPPPPSLLPSVLITYHILITKAREPQHWVRCLRVFSLFAVISYG